MSHQDLFMYQSSQHRQTALLKEAHNARLAREAQKAPKAPNRVLSALQAVQAKLRTQPKNARLPEPIYAPEPSFGK